MFAAEHHQEQVRNVAAVLDRCHLDASTEHPCSYLPGRLARHVAFRVEASFPGLYHAVMDLNFRRSGSSFYRPDCQGCRECRAIRVPAAEFAASRAQRRCWARNTDLDVTVGRPEATEEKHALYEAYLHGRHDGQMDGSQEEFRGFLYESGVETIEICYRHRGTLLSVAIADIEPAALSAVYCYFDPAVRGRSLGVYNVLWLIAACWQMGRRYLYLGYWVAGSPKMSYKARYRPHEVLLKPGEWANGLPDMGQ
jgi:arginyl-tRNA--protein-N-Asp/Glu arginylyltransferase